MKNKKISKFLISLMFFILIVIGREKYSWGEERNISYSLCKKVSIVKLPYDLHWSPDGSEICFRDMGTPGHKNIYFIKSATGETRKIEPLLFLQNIDPKNGVSILATYWSPNGREIALWMAGSLNGKHVQKILIIDSKNSTHSRIYPETEKEGIILHSMNNCWSPDGKKIVLLSGLGQNKYELSVIDSETLKPVQKYNASFISSPAWSPDGKEIYFWDWEGRKDDKSLFCSIKLGQNEKKTMSMGTRFSEVSPSYDRIAWVGKEDSDSLWTGYSLWTANIDGSDKKMVFSTKDREIGGIGNSDLSWSPDGKKIIFNLSFLNHSGPLPQLIDSSIWMVNFDGTGLFQLSPTNAYFCTSPRWSPDGEKIAFVAYFNEGKLKNTANTNLTDEDLLKLGETASYNYRICITKCKN